MCRSINELKLSEERGTEKFLQICNFEKALPKHREPSREFELQENEGEFLFLTWNIFFLKVPEGEDDPELMEETNGSTGNVSFIRKNISVSYLLT